MRHPLRTFLILLAALPMAAAADPAHLVKDIKTGLDPFDSSFPQPSFYGYTALKNRVVFFGLLPEGPFYGAQPQCGLWSTDGTPGGTTRLIDLCTRLEDLDELQIRMLATDGRVAFLTDAGGRLWRTDGTEPGTLPLGAVVSSPYGAGPPVIGPGGVLFFTGCTPVRGCEPWRSDGTPQGTRMLRDIRPGQLASYPGFTVDGKRVLFTAAGGLWTTDGTAAGTTALARVAPETTLMNPPLRRGDKIYFTAYPGPVDIWVYDVNTRKAVRIGSFPVDYRHRSGAVLETAAGRVLIREYDDESSRSVLWETDGTKAGTRPLAPTFFTISPVREAGGRVVFAAVRRYTGTPVPARLWALAPGAKRPTVLTGCPEGCPEVDNDLSPAVTLGGRLYFVGKDAQHGRELWSTDGTGPGTRLVKDLCPGDCESWPYQMAVVSGRLLLVERQGGVWTSDGTPGGTVRLGSAPAPGYPGQPLDLAVLGGRVFFSGFDEVNGFQPWRSDLTPAGTGPIDVIGTPLAASSWPFSLTPLGNQVLFQACDNAAGGLWASDGTEAGTFQLPGSDIPCESSRFFKLFYPVSGIAFYSWNGKLWRTDGTPAGTRELLGLPSSQSIVGTSAPLGQQLLFLVNPDSFPYSTNGWEWTFWSSDGTPQGTRALFPYRFGGSPGQFTASGGLVYFYAQSSESPYLTRLWRTDGTEAGTFPLFVSTSGGGFGIPMLRLGDRTYFIAAQRSAGPELWSTDGTVAGTAPVVSSLTGERPRNPLYPVIFKGAIYFFARSNQDPKVWGLWRSDGTEAGTRMLQALPLPTGYRVEGVPDPEPTVVGNRLFFRLDDNVHGPELWVTDDGTAAGTVMVKDINPGPGTSRIDHLTAVGGRLYFTATDGEHGFELWESDGSESGTRMVVDIRPGPAPSNPDQLTAADGRLYFNADDGEHGRELWVLPLP
jgi:ELWxxDGT repeat protein